MQVPHYVSSCVGWINPADAAGKAGKLKMPTYEYECVKCGKRFEIFQNMKDEPLTTCPDKKCKGRVTRLIGSCMEFQ